MILQALVQYYEALLARGEIDRPGWSKVNVSWRLDLNPDGSLFDVSPLQKPSPNGKKMLPQQLAVPAQVKRSSGVAANFLCDTSSYLLGVDDKGKPERTQEAANPNINTTIKDRFFNSASATPSLVFPTLINLAQKHLAKLNEGQRIALDKSIGELSNKLGETFPKQLMLAEQGAFQLGYYQQRQEYFKKKTDTTEQKEEA